MIYATGWEEAGQARDGSGAAPIGHGPRHAVPAGTRTSVCDREMAQVQDDIPFGHGGLDAPPCSDCLALDRAAASV